MKWEKKGLIFSPDKRKWWQQHYSMMPTPVYLELQDVVRIYFGTTDEDRNGRTTFLDVNADNPSEIISSHDDFIIDIGKKGTFDDSGVIPSSIVQIEGKQFLYYVGFQRTAKVPYMLFSGLAIATDWVSFKKFSEAPIIDRTVDNVYSNAAPFVIYDTEEKLFKMWFWLGKEWITINDKQYINAAIHYATSCNGIQWQLHKEPCIMPVDSNEFSIGRPWVIVSKGKYKMFYSVRYIDKLYRLGYAESLDGISWNRKDNEMRIDVSNSGWDSEMICYPAVLEVKGKTYLFYNGNNNGETGFGYAELIEE